MFRDNANRLQWSKREFVLMLISKVLSELETKSMKKRNQEKFDGMFYTEVKYRENSKNWLIFSLNFRGVWNTPRSLFGFLLVFFERKMKNTKNFTRKCVIFYKGKSFVLMMKKELLFQQLFLKSHLRIMDDEKLSSSLKLKKRAIDNKKEDIKT